MVEDTMPENVKQCSKCCEMKNPDRIVKNRNVCKDCSNKRKRENHNSKVVDESIQKSSSKCNISKTATLFIHPESLICKACNNLKRRNKYQEVEEVRIKKRLEGIKYKRKIKTIRDENKLVELTNIEEEIGKDNTICKYCKEVKSKTNFRHNRLKCKDCERDDP